MTDDLAEAARIAANRERQRELYGTPLGERIRRVTGGLRITQNTLAKALGMSPAMLSQLVSGRRVKIGDPAVLGRLMVLDARCAAGLVGPAEAALLLEEVRSARPGWAGGGLLVTDGPGAPRPAADPVTERAPGPAAVADAATVTPIRATRSASPRLPAPRGAVPAGHGPAPASGAQPSGPAARRSAADALRAVSPPARLVAAAAALDPAFPELADVLRHAAAFGR